MTETRTPNQIAFARSVAREFLAKVLGEESYRWDTEAVVTDLVNLNDSGASSYYAELTHEELYSVLAPHEYDEEGDTEAGQIAAAITASQSGWSAWIRYSEDNVQTLELRMLPGLETPKAVEDLLRAVLRLPEGAGITVFPLVA